MTVQPRAINLSGGTIRVTGDHADFWDRYAANTWEPETFRIFDHYIGHETLHLDVGAWIGPTLLYAARRAKLAVGFEPDPAAFATLEGNVALNPGLPNIRIHRVAIAASTGVLRIGSQGKQGDSMSSSLFADSGTNWVADARRLDEMTRGLEPARDCFVKIDIEGGEYSLLPSLAEFLHSRQATVYLSFHQRFFLQPFLGRGFIQKLYGELRLFLRILRIYPLLRRYPFIYDQHRKRLTALAFLRRRNWRRTDSLLMSYRPAPWDEPPA